MADFRPKPYNNNGEVQTATGLPSNDLRSYSCNYMSSAPAPPQKLKKGKTSAGGSTWSFNDAEFQRKKRVASYKVYSVEGKVKGSFRKSLRWIKDKYAQVLYGLW